MNILAFDTCFSACSVAVGVDLGLPTERLEQFFEPRDLGHAEALMPMIDSAMRSAAIDFADLDRLAVTIGPGTFTGTRIAVSAARAFSVASGVPIIGITSLAAMAEEAADVLAAERADMPLLVAVDARRGEVYAQAFARDGSDPLSKPSVVAVADAAALCRSPRLLVVGSGAQLVVEAARAAGLAAEARLPRLLPDACSVLALAQRNPEATGVVAPLYLREADAKPPAPSPIARLA